LVCAIAEFAGRRIAGAAGRPDALIDTSIAVFICAIAAFHSTDASGQAPDPATITGRGTHFAGATKTRCTGHVETIAEFVAGFGQGLAFIDTAHTLGQTRTADTLALGEAIQPIRVHFVIGPIAVVVE
jgi:hypothetical protein